MKRSIIAIALVLITASSCDKKEKTREDEGTVIQVTDGDTFDWDFRD